MNYRKRKYPVPGARYSGPNAAIVRHFRNLVQTDRERKFEFKEMAHAKALKSIINCKEKINNGDEAQKLPNIGKHLGKIIDKFFDDLLPPSQSIEDLASPLRDRLVTSQHPELYFPKDEKLEKLEKIKSYSREVYENNKKQIMVQKNTKNRKKKSKKFMCSRYSQKRPKTSYWRYKHLGGGFNTFDFGSKVKGRRKEGKKKILI